MFARPAFRQGKPRNLEQEGQSGKIGSENETDPVGVYREEEIEADRRALVPNFH